jgi:hypothetical protein
MKLLGGIRQLAFSGILVGTFVPAVVEGRGITSCQGVWCGFVNCVYGAGLYWAGPGESCEDASCECQQVNSCDKDGHPDYKQCYCTACS